MTIIELLKSLEVLNEYIVIKNINLNDFGSERGDYTDFYIGRCDDGRYTVKDLKEFLINNVINKTFRGYRVYEYSNIHLGCYGYSGNHIDGIFIDADKVILKERKCLYY